VMGGIMMGGTATDTGGTLMVEGTQAARARLSTNTAVRKMNLVFIGNSLVD
jgi:hypothetical protein